MSKDFFHYRNAFKSDHLASADIEELQENNNGKAILTLQKVQYFEGRSVAGRKMDKALVAFFAQDVKPMVINATNAKVLAKLIGSSNVNTWLNLGLNIELYVADTTMKGQRTTGIRIKATLPAIQKPTITDERFTKLVAALESGKYSQDKAFQTYRFTNEQILKIKEVCGG
jgi:hypothetical protein